MINQMIEIYKESKKKIKKRITTSKIQTNKKSQKLFFFFTPWEGRKSATTHTHYTLHTTHYAPRK